MNEAQLVQIWRDYATILLIGDEAQLGPTWNTEPKENPFVLQYRLTPYVRFVENNWPHAMLREVMRMTAGLEVVCSELFYFGQLKPGTSTGLDHPTRAISRLWQEKMHLRYLSLMPEPPGLIYPVCLNITAQSEQEIPGGTSRINLYNVSAVVDHVIWIVESGTAQPHQIGIATPYAAQVDLYHGIFDQIGRTEQSTLGLKSTSGRRDGGQESRRSTWS